jgi:hypothetical protein
VFDIHRVREGEKMDTDSYRTAKGYINELKEAKKLGMGDRIDGIIDDIFMFWRRPSWFEPIADEASKKDYCMDIANKCHIPEVALRLYYSMDDIHSKRNDHYFARIAERSGKVLDASTLYERSGDYGSAIRAVKNASKNSDNTEKELLEIELERLCYRMSKR